MTRRWNGALLMCAALVPLIAPAMAAATPSPQAQFELGRSYRHGAGVHADAARAVALIRAAALRGHAPAMFTLSNMLVEGEGAARDLAQARHWLEAAAALDYPEALQQLALNTQGGVMGYERDEARSAQLMRQAAHALRHRAHQH